MQTMLAVVCRTYDGVKALETYDKEGSINKNAGIHGLGASIGRHLDGRFRVICLETLRCLCLVHCHFGQSVDFRKIF